MEPSACASEYYEFSEFREKEPALGFTVFLSRVSEITHWLMHEKTLAD